MSTTLRTILLKEFGLKETKKLMNISKFIRSNSRMSKEEKCECCVCKAKSDRLFPNEENTEYIYNHHVMKVEYLAILADKYDLCYADEKAAGKRKLTPNDFKFKKGFEPYCPRVAVCNDHHTVFHELVGDNPIDKVKDLRIEEANNIVTVFEELNEEARFACSNKACNCNIKDIDKYQKSYQRIWDETLVKSLTRLEYIVRLNQIKNNSWFSDFLENDEDLDMYDMVIDRIEKVKEDVMNFDEENQIVLPEVDMFTETELIALEAELELYDCALEDIADNGNDLFDELDNVILGNECFDDTYLDDENEA